jgi:hypothetical protein
VARKEVVHEVPHLVALGLAAKRPAVQEVLVDQREPVGCLVIGDVRGHLVDVHHALSTLPILHDHDGVQIAHSWCAILTKMELSSAPKKPGFFPGLSVVDS